MNPHNYIDKKKLVGDGDRLKRIAKENRELLIRINTINRTKGMIDSYNPNAYDDRSHWRRHELEMFQIEKENKKIYKRLITAVLKFQLQSIVLFICQYCSNHHIAGMKWKNSGAILCVKCNIHASTL